MHGREVGKTRAALVLISGFESGDGLVRLVQEFGRPGSSRSKLTAV